jgi:hypothetical protein
LFVEYLCIAKRASVCPIAPRRSYCCPLARAAPKRHGNGSIPAQARFRVRRALFHDASMNRTERRIQILGWLTSHRNHRDQPSPRFLSCCSLALPGRLSRIAASARHLHLGIPHRCDPPPRFHAQLRRDMHAATLRMPLYRRRRIIAVASPPHRSRNLHHQPHQAGELVSKFARFRAKSSPPRGFILRGGDSVNRSPARTARACSAWRSTACRAPNPSRRP